MNLQDIINALFFALFVANWYRCNNLADWLRIHDRRIDILKAEKAGERVA